MHHIREFMLMDEYPNADVFGQPVVEWPEERIRAFRAIRLARAKSRTTQAVTGAVMADASAAQATLHRAFLRETG